MNVIQNQTIQAKKILVLGAGRSTIVLINKLLQNAEANNWFVDIADLNYESAKKLVTNNKNSKAIVLDSQNDFSIIENYDIIISMLPPQMHYVVAQSCLKFGKHLITASYNTPEIQSLNSEAKQKKLLFLMECGLDPGIDHMSAIQMIDEIHAQKGTVTSFKSYCGGLMTDISDEGNPWKYKVTWNPRNVVLAGQGGLIKYLQNDAVKHLNYTRLFRNPEQLIIDQKDFEGYPNRDSLKYIELYKLKNCTTFIRGTLRKQGFCKAWNALILLGFTDDQNEIKNLTGLSNKDFFFSLIPFNLSKNWRDELKSFYIDLIDNEVLDKFEYLGLFSNEKIPFSNFTPAQLLQLLLETKLKLDEDDTDLVVMQHLVEYTDSNGVNFRREASIVIEGEKTPFTAMSKTVGLPIYYALELILNSKIEEFGVKLPTEDWIYKPILKNLINDGIQFKEYLTQL